MDATGMVRTTGIVLALLAVPTTTMAVGGIESEGPVEVSGTEREGPCPTGTSLTLGTVEQNRGVTCLHVWTVSDPWLTGTYTRISD